MTVDYWDSLVWIGGFDTCTATPYPGPFPPLYFTSVCSTRGICITRLRSPSPRLVVIVDEMFAQFRHTALEMHVSWLHPPTMVSAFVDNMLLTFYCRVLNISRTWNNTSHVVSYVEFVAYTQTIESYYSDRLPAYWRASLAVSLWAWSVLCHLSSIRHVFISRSTLKYRRVEHNRADRKCCTLVKGVFITCVTLLENQ